MLIPLTYLVFAIHALPNGAPKCGINEAAIQSGMNSASDISLGYTLQVAPAGNNNWNITITNKAGRTDYQGILMYVHQLATPSNHLGEFSFTDQTKWKYQPTSLCTSNNINSSTSKSTVTHATPDRAAMSTVFVWTAPSAELALSGLVVNAVVASLDKGQNGVARWQHVSFFGIPPTPGIDASSSVSVTNAPSTTTQASLTPTQPTSTSTATQTIMVGSVGQSYDQPITTANVGDTIVWMFGTSAHTVTQTTDASSCIPQQDGFDSGRMVQPATFTQVLNATGSVYYMCTVGSHCSAGMKGQILVGGATVSGPKLNAASRVGGSLAVVVFVVLLNL